MLVKGDPVELTSPPGDKFPSTAKHVTVVTIWFYIVCVN